MILKPILAMAILFSPHAVAWAQQTHAAKQSASAAAPIAVSGPGGGAFRPEFIGMHTLSPKNDWPSVPVGAVRTSGVSWAAVEPTRGKFNWNFLDIWVAQAAAHHAQIDYLFYATPTWASTQPTTKGACGNPGCNSPPGLADWTAFVTAVVTRYKGRIQSYELWNEVNSSGFWTGSVAQMEQMAAAAYPIIKSIDPNAVVVSPSVVYAAWPTAFDIWLAEFLQAGGGNYADAIAFHGYAGRNNLPAQPPEIVANQVSSLRAVLAKSGYSNLPLWDTEGGYGKNSQISTAQGQADFLARWYMIQFGLGVKRAYWYQWDNPLWGTLHTSEGLTAAGVEMGAVYSWLNGITSSSPCTVIGPVWTCRFSKGSASYKVAWTTSTQSTRAAVSSGNVVLTSTPQLIPDPM